MFVNYSVNRMIEDAKIAVTQEPVSTHRRKRKGVGGGEVAQTKLKLRQEKVERIRSRAGYYQ